MAEIKVGMKVRVISSVEQLKESGFNGEIVKDIEFNRNRIYTVTKVRGGVLKLEEFKDMPSSWVGRMDVEVVEDKIVKIKDKIGFSITLFDEVSEMLEELRTTGAKRCASCGEYDEDLHPTFNVCLNCFSTGE